MGLAASHCPSLLVCLLLLLALGTALVAGDAAGRRLYGHKPARKAAAGSEPVFRRLPNKNSRPGGRKRSAVELKLQSHCFPSGPPCSILELLASDGERAAYIQLQVESSMQGNCQEGASKATMPLVSGARLRTLNYVTTVELGSEEMTVIIDTGSDLTWVQCKPCIECHDQLGPLFDPSASRSYRRVPCNSTSCSALHSATWLKEMCGASEPACSYALSYSDGSFSDGVLAQDSMNLAGNVVDKFIFGCGTSNQGLFGGASGLMGLGRSELSLISQTAEQFKGTFSYCLPSRNFNSVGSLVLGDDPASYRNSTPFVHATMISDPSEGPLYFLNLTGISIGGKWLSAAGFSTGRTTIDSGTIITRVIPSIYTAIRSEFTSQMLQYPTAPGFSILDTCFNLAGLRDVEVPRMKLEFDGSSQVEIDPSGVVYMVREDLSQVCLAVAPLSNEYETGIIGNYQQRNLRIVYDTASSVLGFAQETCDRI